MTRINLKQLTDEIQNLERHQALYKVLKSELTKLGFWKNKPRGNPAKGYKMRKTTSSL